VTSVRQNRQLDEAVGKAKPLAGLDITYPPLII
jgi:hypothetical protein